MKKLFIYFILFSPLAYYFFSFNNSEARYDKMVESTVNSPDIDCDALLNKDKRKYSKNFYSQINYLNDLEDNLYEGSFRGGQFNGYYDEIGLEGYKKFGLSGNYQNDKVKITKFKNLIEKNEILSSMYTEETEILNPLAYAAFNDCIDKQYNSSVSSSLEAKLHNNYEKDFSIKYIYPCGADAESKRVRLRLDNCYFNDVSRHEIDTIVNRGQILILKFVKEIRNNSSSVYCYELDKRITPELSKPYKILNSKLISEGNEQSPNNETGYYHNILRATNYPLYFYSIPKNEININNTYFLNFGIKGYFETFSGAHQGSFNISIKMNGNQIASIPFTSGVIDEIFVKFYKDGNIQINNNSLRSIYDDSSIPNFIFEIGIEDIYYTNNAAQCYLEDGTNVTFYEQNNYN